MTGFAILVGISVLGIGPGLVVGRMVWKRTDPIRRDRDAALIITVVAAFTVVCVTSISFFFGHTQYHPPTPVGHILPLAILAGLCASLVMAFGFFIDISMVRSRASRGDRSGGAPRGHRRAVLGRSIASVVGGLVLLRLGIWPNIVTRLIGANESMAQSSLERTFEAQHTFHQTDFYEIGRHVFANPVDGRGFVDLYELKLAEGPKRKWPRLKRKRPRLKRPRLLSLGMSEASANGEGKPWARYYYSDITGTREGPYDYTKEFGLCAFPDGYGVYGINTYIIDVSGVIYYKDTGGSPVTTWPDVVAEGWVILRRR